MNSAQRQRIESALDDASIEIERARTEVESIELTDEEDEIEDGALDDIEDLTRLVERAIELGRRHHPMPADWVLLLSDMRELMGEAIGART